MDKETVLRQIWHHLGDGDVAEFHGDTLLVTGSKNTIAHVYIVLCNHYRKRYITFTQLSNDSCAFEWVTPVTRGE
jgi:hypothetical protein